MNRIVCKFGGSVFADTAGTARFLQAAGNYNCELYCVVSAFYGITDKLESLVNESPRTGKRWQLSNIIKKNIFSPYAETLLSYCHDFQLIINTFNQFDAICDNLIKDIGLYHFDRSAREKNMAKILAIGEQLSVITLTAVLQSNDFNARELWPEECGLVADGSYLDGSIDFNNSKFELNVNGGKKIYVIPGFYSLNKADEIVLTGRGGSDYIAAAMAYVIDAERLDIWKDVDGYRTADPEYTGYTRKINRLHFGEAAELSYFGAKILHPLTIDPLAKKNIPSGIYDIKSPGDINPITIIDGNKESTPEIIKSITSSDDFAIVKFRGSGVGSRQGIIAKISNLFELNGINIKSIITSQTVINFLISSDDIEKSSLICSSLNGHVREFSIMNDISVLAVVGHGINEQPGIAAGILIALADRKINCRMIVLGASDFAAYFVITPYERISALKAVHEHFFREV